MEASIKIVCLVGPPGAGKTSLTACLEEHGQVFRLRSEVSRHDLVDGSGATREWLDLPVVQHAFEGAVRRASQQNASLMVCDNFPGNKDQVTLVQEVAIANTPSVPVVVHLMAPHAVIVRRLQEVTERVLSTRALSGV